MGESKRMISSLVYEYPKFTKMKAMAKLLYTYMILYADEYGVCADYERARLEVGASRKDLETLVSNEYVLQLDEDVYLIKHFMMFNSFRKDRVKPCRFSKALALVELGDDKVYRWRTNDNQLTTNGGQLTTKCPPKISKDNIREDKLIQDNINELEEWKAYLRGQ